MRLEEEHRTGSEEEITGDDKEKRKRIEQ